VHVALCSACLPKIRASASAGNSWEARSGTSPEATPSGWTSSSLHQRVGHSWNHSGACFPSYVNAHIAILLPLSCPDARDGWVQQHRARWQGLMLNTWQSTLTIYGWISALPCLVHAPSHRTDQRYLHPGEKLRSWKDALAYMESHQADTADKPVSTAAGVQYPACRFSHQRSISLFRATSTTSQLHNDCLSRSQNQPHDNDARRCKAQSPSQGQGE
jgi:hypothetical protein